MAKRMTKAELAAKLREIADLASGDPETAHSLADKLLLDYIGDDEVTAAFWSIEKWYA